MNKVKFREWLDDKIQKAEGEFDKEKDMVSRHSIGSYVTALYDVLEWINEND